jgi:hypothetical protein
MFFFLAFSLGLEEAGVWWWDPEACVEWALRGLEVSLRFLKDQGLANKIITLVYIFNGEKTFSRLEKKYLVQESI